jgi:hypothetical protein
VLGLRRRDSALSQKRSDNETISRQPGAWSAPLTVLNFVLSPRHDFPAHTGAELFCPVLAGRAGANQVRVRCVRFCREAYLSACSYRRRELSDDVKCHSLTALDPPDLQNLPVPRQTNDISAPAAEISLPDPNIPLPSLLARKKQSHRNLAALMQAALEDDDERPSARDAAAREG